MNAEQYQATANLKPTDLGSKSTCRLLLAEYDTKLLFCGGRMAEG